MLTAAGMIGLTGVNAAGVGVCVNTLAMLRHSDDGLPVAFVMRGVLERTSAAAARGVPRAGRRTRRASTTRWPTATASPATSARRRVRSRSDDGGGRLCHTNHPLRSADLDPARRAEGEPDSHVRLAALATAAPDVASGEDCERVLADRDAPLSVVPEPGRPWITFGSIWAELGAAPRVRVAPGPPDRTAWLDCLPA